MLFLKNVQYDYMSTTCAHLILEFRVKGQLNAQIFLEHLRITPTPKCLKRKLTYKEASLQKRNKDKRRRQINACYRVFMKYCVFSQKFATSPSPALGCYLQKNCQPIGVNVHSQCVESFEGLLQRCRRGRGCSEL